MANHRAKMSESWDSEVIVEHIWGTFDLISFKVIWGHSGHLQFFLKYAFRKAASSTLMVFSTIFIAVPCDSPQTVTSWIFEI